MISSGISFYLSQSIVDGSGPQRIACCLQDCIILDIIEANSPEMIIKRMQS